MTNISKQQLDNISNRISVYFIIVTWNAMNWIDRCLSSLSQSSYPHKTIIIDNKSTDNTVDYIKEKFPGAILLEQDKNLGFGQANNIGMRYALDHSCDYVFLLNQDAYVFPDMLDCLIEQAEIPENKEKYAIYAPLHLSPDTSRFDKQYKDYIKEISTSILEDQLLGTTNPIYPVTGVPAAGWLLPKHTLDIIGGFDPIFFHYGEDHHYIQRVNYQGFKTGLVLKAKMIHDRDDFGNRTLAQKDIVYRSLKTEIFLNINLRKNEIIRKLSHLFILFTFESLKNLLNGNFYMIKEYLKSFILNFLHLHKYSVDRKINKQLGHNWL